MTIEITRSFRFESAHFLSCHKGKCKNLHGHSYRLEVSVEGGIDSSTNMILDFGDLDSIVKASIIEILDHTLLNDVFVDLSMKENPTAETMAVWILDCLQTNLSCSRYHLSQIKLYETENSWVIVKP
jgi:6-pyruvoyltetrahydropterin/6-carboxytetrahydropterin synthase